MNKAYLLTGGNTGDSKSYLLEAAHLISACGKIATSSCLYETAAWGKTDQPAFLNQVLELHTEMDAPTLMKALLTIELTMGRERMEKYGPRIIDIDILLFNSEIINSELVTVPHPQLPNRRFALAPLADIAPLFIHPLLHKTILRLLMDCADPLPVKKLG